AGGARGGVTASSKGAEMSRVLMVDASTTQVNQVRELLGETSFDLDTASSLAEGLERAKQRNVDVVLLALSLPDSEGMETFYRFRDAQPGLPTVILTNTDDARLAAHAVESGAQDWLVNRS